MSTSASCCSYSSRPVPGGLACALVAIFTLTLAASRADAAAVAADASGGYVWPDKGMGQRTSERVAAGKRAAKYIHCEVCEEVVLDLLPWRPAIDVEGIDRLLESGKFAEALGEAKKLCGMKHLAQLLTHRRMEITTKPDGSAEMKQLPQGQQPFYEEINTSELVFHWQSLAVQHSCTEVFRKDGDIIAQGFEEAYRRTDEAASDGEGELARRVVLAAREACHSARMCRSAHKLRFGVGKTKPGSEL